MARPRSTDGLSLAQLERLMQSRRTELNRLTRQRDKIQKKLDTLNDRISEISGGMAGGTRGGGGGTRARNAMNLPEVIHQVLSKSGSAVGVGDIMDKVRAAGYRSNSANFRGIVNQTLIKDKRFSSAARGVYQLKK